MLKNNCKRQSESVANEQVVIGLFIGHQGYEVL